MANSSRIEDELRQEIASMKGEIEAFNKSSIKTENLEEIVEALVNNSSILMVIIDSERVVHNFNERVLEFNDSSELEIINKPLGNALRCLKQLDDPRGCGYGPDCKKCLILKTVKDAIKKKKNRRNVRASLTYKTDVKEEQLELLVSTFVINHGRDRFLVSIEDITARINLEKAEKDLQFKERKYEDLTELLPQIVFEIDLKGKILYVNQRGFEVFGYTVEEMTEDVNIFQMVPSSEVPKILKNIKSIIRGKGLDSPEYTAKKKNGELFPVLIYASLILKNNKPIGIRGVIIDLSDQKKFDSELQESEERYRRLAENSPDMLYRMSIPDGRYEYVSPASTSIFGYSPEEFYDIDRLIERIIHPDWNSYFNDKWDELLKGEVPEYYEYEIIHKSGKRRWINQRNLLISDENGNPIAIEGIVNDVTKQKKVEFELQESVERFDYAVRASNDGIYDWNLLTNDLYFSDVFKEILGYDGEDIPEDKDTWEKIIHPDDLETSLKLINDLKSGKKDRFEVEIRMKHKDGHWKPLLSRAMALVNEQGEAVRIIGSNKDMEELKKVEREAIAERNIAHQYLEVAGVMLIFIDNDGIVRMINKRGCELLGCKEEEIIGENWFENFIPKEDYEDILEIGRKISVGSAEEFSYHENRVITKQGIRLFSWQNASMKDDKGNIIGSLSSGEDITDRKLAEEELIRHKEKLEEMVSQRTKDLEKKNKELQDMIYTFVGRELKIKELTEELEKKNKAANKEKKDA